MLVMGQAVPPRDGFVTEVPLLGPNEIPGASEAEPPLMDPVLGVSPLNGFVRNFQQGGACPCQVVQAVGSENVSLNRCIHKCETIKISIESQ